MSEPELWTTAEAAEYLGASSAGSGRKTLSRLGVVPLSREPGRGGQNLYQAAEVRAAKARMPGRGKRALAADAVLLLLLACRAALVLGPACPGPLCRKQ